MRYARIAFVVGALGASGLAIFGLKTDNTANPHPLPLSFITEAK